MERTQAASRPAGAAEEWSATNMDSDGNVMNGNWNDGKCKLNWNNRGGRDADGGPRSEVYKRPYRGVLCLSDLIQPFAIFDTSIKWCDSAKYVF